MIRGSHVLKANIHYQFTKGKSHSSRHTMTSTQGADSSNESVIETLHKDFYSPYNRI